MHPSHAHHPRAARFVVRSSKFVDDSLPFLAVVLGLAVGLMFLGFVSQVLSNEFLVLFACGLSIVCWMLVFVHVTIIVAYKMLAFGVTLICFVRFSLGQFMGAILYLGGCIAFIVKLDPAYTFLPIMALCIGIYAILCFLLDHQPSWQQSSADHEPGWKRLERKQAEELARTRQNCM